MDVDIVIVSYNTKQLLRAALNSVDQHGAAGIHTSCIVIDNGSSDGSPEMVRSEFPDAQLISLNSNIGFGAANNRGIAAGSAPFILFMNSDAELTPGALAAITGYMEDHPDCVIVGPRLTYPDGSFQPSCRHLPNPLRNFWMTSGLQDRHPNRFPNLRNWLSEKDHETEQDVDMVSGACFLARRDYLEALGCFDENLFMYEEETDISIPAMRRGRSISYCPDSIVIHHGGASVASTQASSFSLRHLYRSKYRCFRKHYGPMAAWITYATDQILYQKSAFVNKLRGSESDARGQLKESRRGWRESFKTIAELRDKPDFFSE